MTQYTSIHHLLEERAAQSPDAPVIHSPGRPPLTYERLYRHVEAVVQTLRTMGLGRHDRVAVVLPQGPEMAVAFLAIAAGATCVPLNPNYSAEELQRYLAELQAKTLLLQTGIESPARTVAQAQGLRLINLSPCLEAEAGLFTLSSISPAPTVGDGFAQPDDVALVLQSSGTTAQPKIALLTHRTLCRWAHDVRQELALVAHDRCLNVMPLFHGHGLLVTTVAPMVAGASIVYPAGFSASQFFACLDEFRPTWYSASPTIHQAVLASAASYHEIIARCPLRFIRSSSAPLPLRVLTELERVFCTPVIEAYGLTELHVQVTCNPLPPGQRQIGSVGLAATLEVAIMDETGILLPAGHTGEVVVRGASALAGGEAFPTLHGWFRTGDQGYIDTAGYLFITGRLKEIINRGGEKITPQEVDDVLMDHPAVTQAVTFAVPHTRLGEDVAAAVVLHQNSAVTAQDLRQFVMARLAAFKVPQHIYIVPELPQSATGKVQRRSVAQQLSVAAPAPLPVGIQADFLALRTLEEELLAGLWIQVLGVERLGGDDNFFALGGDSILAMQLLSRIRDVFHVELPIHTFFETPTIAALARRIDAIRQTHQEVHGLSMVPQAREEALLVSVAQAQLWALDRVLPGMPWFNIVHAVRLTGVLNVVALERSCNEIVRRHEVLRTTFATVAGQPVPVIAPELRLLLPVDDLRACPEPERENAVQRLMQEEALRPFSLEQGPLFRVRLLRLDAQESLLLVTLHNIVSDGWSIGVLTHELAMLYEAYHAGRPSPLLPLPIQYADFACWQRRWQHSEAWTAQLTYWRQQLHAPLPSLALPTDYPRTATLRLSTASQAFELPRELSEALTRLSRHEGTTLFMTLVAAVNILLYGYTRQRDIIVATLMARRNRQELEGLIGLLTNTVLLRTQLAGNPSLREVMQRVRETTLAAYTYQDLPFDDLVQTLEREQGLQRESLCRVMFVLQNATLQPPALSNLTLRLLEPEQHLAAPTMTPTTFDLIMLVYNGPEGLRGRWVYKTHLFRATTINRMLQDFRAVLEHLAAQPEQLLLVFDGLVHRQR